MQPNSGNTRTKWTKKNDLGNIIQQAENEVVKGRSEFNDAAANTGRAVGNIANIVDPNTPLITKFNNAKELVQNTRNAVGNSTALLNRVKSGYSKLPKGSYQNVPQSQKIGTGQRINLPTKLPYGSYSNYQPKGGSSGGSVGGMNSYNYFEQVNGYAVINDSSIPTPFSSSKDTSLYENPYVKQHRIGTNDSVTARTIVNVINPSFFYGDTENDILREVYTGWKQEVNSNTNGGNKVTDEKFTYTNVKKYLEHVWPIFFHLVELMSRQAWATEDYNSNKVLRIQAYLLTSDPQMLTIRNLMASNLSNFVLPQTMYDYAYWLLEVHCTNHYKHSIDQFFCTNMFASTILAEDTNATHALDNYKSNLKTLCTISDSDSELFSQISALFQAKTSNKWINLRYIRKPSNTTSYDRAWNDIFANQQWAGAYNAHPELMVPPHAATNTTIPVVFSTDISDVQCHVTETFFHRYAGGYPLLWRPAVCDGLENTYQGFNKFYLFEFPNNVKGFAAVKKDSWFDQVGNDAVRVNIQFAEGSKPTATAFWIVEPKGEQHYLYDVAYPAIVLARRMLAAKIFS